MIYNSFFSTTIAGALLVLTSFSGSLNAQCTVGCDQTFNTCANIATIATASGTAADNFIVCISPPAGCGNITVGNTALGQYQRANQFHEQALEIARNAGDLPCEIANLNHLSRTCVSQKIYAEAINYSQRALILSRQAGDRLGEANALVNLGYSEVFQATLLEQIEPETYETAIRYLQQGLKLSEQLGEIQSQALCFSNQPGGIYKRLRIANFM